MRVRQVTHQEPDLDRIAALERRQRQLSRRIHLLAVIAVLLTVFVCWQQSFNRSLVAQNEGLVELIRLMQPIEVTEPSQPPARL